MATPTASRTTQGYPRIIFIANDAVSDIWTLRGGGQATRPTTPPTPTTVLDNNPTEHQREAFRQLANPTPPLHADPALKEQAIARTAPLGTKPGRYRPSDPVLAWLQTL